jgi:PAS domain S-box-containing protein
MVRDATKARVFNVFILFLIAFMLIVVGGVSGLIIYSAMNAGLNILNSVAYLLLLLIDLPLSFFLYFNMKDRVYKTILSGLSLTFLIYAIASLVLLVSLFGWGGLPWASTLSKVIMAFAYPPLIYALYTVLKQPGAGTQDSSIRNLVLLQSSVAGVLVLGFSLLTLGRVTYQGFDTQLYGVFTLFDIALMALCVLLLLGHMATQYRYPFAVIFACALISFLGDSMSMVSNLGLIDLRAYSHSSLGLVLITSTIAMVFLSLVRIRTTTVEEVGRELSDTRMQLEDIIAQSPDAMALFDVDGTMLMANDAHRAFLELMPSNASKMSLSDQITYAGPQLSRQADDLRDGRPISANDIPVYLSASQDRLSYMSTKIFPTFAGDRRISGFVSISQDTTDRKKAEETLLQSNEELERRVNERTFQMELTNRALQHEIEARMADAEHIKASLHEKEVLLREIHHRVKNNLQVISSLLSLQSAGLSDQVAISMNLESQNRIRSMALIHEKLYQSGSLSRIDFGGYLESLTGVIQRSYTADKQVSVSIDVKDVLLTIDTAIPCGLIINELLTNALKYAFQGRDTGKIRVHMALAGPNYELTVEDDGVGIADRQILEKTSTLGLKLVTGLVRQLNGRIEMTSMPGTKFTIVFPLPARAQPEIKTR